jgi:endonuclease/exonuclease/phosphatase family metal-dependent hydrolase
MTFNTKGFGVEHSERNLKTSERIFDFVKEENPDIICFQEFSGFESKMFQHYPYSFIGYRTNFEKTLQAIYSKYPIVSRGYVDFPNTRNQTTYVDININSQIIRVYNIHLQSYKFRSNKLHLSVAGLEVVARKVGVGQSKQEEQVQIILNHSKKFSGKVIFAGDFNSTQYSTNYKFLKKNKNDSFVEAAYGIGTTYSRHNLPFRIDYVLVDKGIEVLSHQNYNLKISDHEPILVNLRI